MIPLQESSKDIWEQKYKLVQKDGVEIDKEPLDSLIRTAKFLAKNEARKEFWEEGFIWAVKNGAIPAGRIISNADAKDIKNNVSLINCTVSDKITDSIDGIYTSVKEAATTLAAGCGIGYEFSTLRPNHAYVSGAGAETSGALGFMGSFDQMCFNIASAGGRRGAQMGTFDIEHPDILQFIKSKREDGVFRQFNLSLLITEKFIKAVKNNSTWILSFPVTKKEYNEKEHTYFRKFTGDISNYVENDKGEVACRIFDKLPAKDLWDLIMHSTYDFAEPGFLLIDEINKTNNLWWDETIRATNPCGEQPLPPYGACLLGSINLTKCVENPFTNKAYFNWEKYSELIRIFTRMLDNVVEHNNLPLSKQRDEILRKRRHGMGFLGLGSTMVMLGMQYGKDEAIAFTEKVSKTLALEGWYTGVVLAKEKGSAPIFYEVFSEYDNATGIELFCQSKYMEKIFKEKPELQHIIAQDYRLKRPKYKVFKD